MRTEAVDTTLRQWLEARGREELAQPLDLEPYLRPELRIVEVGERDFGFSAALQARGHEKLLALCLASDDATFDEVRVRHPALGEALLRWGPEGSLGSNSADVLVLSTPAALDRLRRHRHARTLLFAPPPGPDAAQAALRFAREALRDRARGPKLVGVGTLRDVDGSPRCVLVAANGGRKEETARRFVPRSLGVPGFFRMLERRGVRYVVLRWFEDLPHVPPGEDLDLLVADEDIPQVEEILTLGPGVAPIDLYSASGLPGTAFRRMAYYPPSVAEGILERAERPRPPYRVPCPEDHFLSLAYHALYHKGEASGLPSDDPAVKPVEHPEHDYGEILLRLADRLGLPVPMRLEALDTYLGERGWRPSLDALARLARRNAWLARRVEQLVESWRDEAPPGLAVFLVRQRALDLGFVDEIVGLVEESGFQILLRETLEAEAQNRVARGARGGNWERGPYPTSGGPPALLLAAYDPAPVAPSQADRDRHPGLENARMLIKNRIRDRLNDRLPEHERCNLVHSSDHAWGALEYLRLASPARVAAVTARILEDRGSGASERGLR